MRVVNSTYTGNGVDNRAIIGLGFQPAMVWVQRDASVYHLTVKTPEMPAGYSKRSLTGPLITGAIKSLDSDGFTLGTTVNVNENGVLYYWMAFGADATCLKTGTYTGTGSGDNHNVTGVGFQPDLICLMPDAASGDLLEWHKSRGGDQTNYWFTGLGPGWSTDQIQGVAADGFQYGSNTYYVNANGVHYYYICFKAKTNNLYVSAFTGDGGGARDIVMEDPFQPLLVHALKFDTVPNSMTRYRFGITGAYSWIPACTNATNGLKETYSILAINSNGFRVGSDFNGYNCSFYYFAIKDLLSNIPAEMQSPANGSTLPSTTQTFVWNVGGGADHYHLAIGSALGGSDLYNADVTGTSQAVTGLPNNGSTIYVRLTTVFTDSSSGYHDYSYTAVTQVDRVFRLEVESLQALSRKFRLEVETPFGWVIRRFRLPIEASGSALRRKFVLPVAVLSRHAVARRFNLPIETVRTFGRSFHLPIEWTGTQLLMRPFVLPIEAAANPGRTFVLPVEWVAGRLPPRKFMLPIEAKGALGRAFHLPVEATGQNILYRKFRLPVALSARLRRAWRLPIEASGLSTGFVDSWNVWQKLDDLFLDQWVVIPVVEVLQFSDTWNVKSVLGGRFTDTWRVLPREIVTLFSTDIQLPSGTVDKT